MREAKQSTSTIPEAQRNATRRALNSEMQKLLGDSMYQKYRQVRVANTAKGKGGDHPAALASPPPPTPTTNPAKKGGKKKKGLLGTVKS